MLYVCPIAMSRGIGSTLAFVPIILADGIVTRGQPEKNDSIIKYYKLILTILI